MYLGYVYDKSTDPYYYLQVAWKMSLFMQAHKCQLQEVLLLNRNLG